MRMNNRYNEIINLPHHVSKTRPQMPMSDRAAQFAPFAALTGYDSAIKETGRLTDERIELDKEALTALDMRYQLLMDAFDDAPEVTITYFQADERKAGGKYVSAVGAVKKIDDFERWITMQDGTKIPMDDVLRQHRTIRQGVSDRIFAPIQSLENEGILYVFLVFQTEEVGQKDGGDSQTQLCGVALSIDGESFSSLE